VTIDEELTQLEDFFRRLKVEYDIYFAGGAKRPPVDNESRFNNQIRYHLESTHFTFAQRYRLNGIMQKYSVFSDLWRRKAKIKEQGFRRREDTLLGVGGFGHIDSGATKARPGLADGEPESFVILSDDVMEVVALYECVVRAREAAGQPLGAFDTFANFVQNKSSQIRTQFHCHAVEYTVMVQGGQVRLKARPRKDV
jgi:hypothetical protein